MEVIIIIKLDYTIESPEERNELVKKILEENPDPNPAYLEILANYLVLCMEKQEKKQKQILTENRMTTVNKRVANPNGSEIDDLLNHSSQLISVTIVAGSIGHANVPLKSAHLPAFHLWYICTVLYLGFLVIPHLLIVS